MPIILSRIAKRLYTRVAALSWDIVLTICLLHFFTSWLLFAAAGEEIAGANIFWYFYATTATTVGYGDFSPATTAGRVITILWIMPGGIALFTTIVAKVIQLVSDKWRRRMRGLASYENLTGHVVILGWHGSRTERMLEHIKGGQGNEELAIVLCSAQNIENPMPEQVRFVRGVALNAPDVLKRSAAAAAKNIIALGSNDDETLAAALGAAAASPQSHIVAYFDQPSFAQLLKAHCPQAECTVSLSIELMVRSAQDPGSSRVQGQLLSTLEGPTQYSFKVPDSADAIDYGVLFLELKNKHDATLFGIAKSTLGDDLVLNARAGERIYPGMIVYFMSADRIEPEQIDWAELGHATGLGVIPTA